MPFHNGHRYLIDFASQYVETLFVLVCSLQNEPIKGELRYSWVSELFAGKTNIIVVHCTDENPQYPEEHPDFWNIWRETIVSRVPQKIDLLFASEMYGYPLANIVWAQFIPVDIARSILPVSGTAIRENPFKYWDFLPETTKKHYLKKICIIGPESCGKTTLTHELAKHFQTIAVDEYARGYLASKNDECFYEDIEKIALGHKASEQALEAQCNKYMFLDTDIITTCIYSRALFQKVPDWCESYSYEKKYDYYLLLDIDTPFTEDPQRYFPEKRKWLFETFEKEIQKRNLPYSIVSGIGEQRKINALTILESVIEMK